MLFSLLWNGWHVPVGYVRAGTVVRWQHERFRRSWVNHHRSGRPATAANPPWRAPGIHGELKMLGIEVAKRTISRIIRKLPRPPSQTWKTFLHNHLGHRHIRVSSSGESMPAVLEC